MRAETDRDALTADIVAHYNKDLSAERIGRLHGVTKGVVIGMARKLGLQHAGFTRAPRPPRIVDNAPAPVLVPAPERKQVIVNLTKARAKLGKPAKAVPVVSATLPPPPPRNRPYSIHKQCQWMGGRWDVIEPMCCMPTVESTSWCAEHKARVMVPILRRGKQQGEAA